MAIAPSDSNEILEEGWCAVLGRKTKHFRPEISSPAGWIEWPKGNGRAVYHGWLLGMLVWESWMAVWGDHDCFLQDSCMLARGTVDVAWGIMNGRLGHHEW